MAHLISSVEEYEDAPWKGLGDDMYLTSFMLIDEP